MFTVRTAAGARSTLRGEHAALPAVVGLSDGEFAGGCDDVNVFLHHQGIIIKRDPATATCVECKQESNRKSARATPRRGILCMRCVVRLGAKCYVPFDC